MKNKSISSKKSQKENIIFPEKLDFNNKEALPFSLYIHIPWCVKKCPYCDFNSHTLKGELPQKQYIDCLISDLKDDLQLISDRKLISIFIGGGTPSLLSEEILNYLISEIDKIITLPNDIEITMEANPGTFEVAKFIGYKKAGINRLSLGIQSFNDNKLLSLGRIHSSNEAIIAYKKAREFGFDNINLDLMFALPDQSVNEAIKDLETAIKLNPNHISWYQLTLEPNTLFFHKPPQLPNHDSAWEIQTTGWKLLRSAGFEKYEVSAYAKEKKYSRHNLNYWEFGDYLGIGAGAHSKLTNIKENFVERIVKVKNPKDYLNPNKKFTSSRKEVKANELPFEFMLNLLRLEKGFSYEVFEKKTGLPRNTVSSIISELENSGLMVIDCEWIRPTDLGRRFMDDLVIKFMRTAYDRSTVSS